MRVIAPAKRRSAVPQWMSRPTGLYHCGCCKRDLRSDHFYRSRRTGKRLSRCKDCRRTVALAYYHNVKKVRAA